MSRSVQLLAAILCGLTFLGVLLGAAFIITSTYAVTVEQETALATLAVACAVVPYIALRTALVAVMLLAPEDP